MWWKHKDAKPLALLAGHLKYDKSTNSLHGINYTFQYRQTQIEKEIASPDSIISNLFRTLSFMTLGREPPINLVQFLPSCHESREVLWCIQNLMHKAQERCVWSQTAIQDDKCWDRSLLATQKRIIAVIKSNSDLLSLLYINILFIWWLSRCLNCKQRNAALPLQHYWQSLGL